MKTRGGSEVRSIARRFGGTGSGGVSDGDKGDIVVSGGGTVWTLDPAIAIPTAGSAVLDFGDAPIYVNPGEFVALVAKFLIGTATASQTISFVWQPVYGWE